MTRVVIVGGGIVGMATAYELTRSRPDAQVTLLEKESRWAAHQTGRNSGVIHAGVYYPPGSFKARMCRDGNASMSAFAEEHGIAWRRCGKLVVASTPAEVPGLRRIFDRAKSNGLPVREMSRAEAREIEPHVACVAAFHSPTSGIVDYAAVTDTLARLAAEGGADLRRGTAVVGLTRDATATVVSTTGGDVTADVVINCAGLYSDRIATLAGLEPEARIVPFRGEYYTLRPERSHLVNGLIYPVPNPDLPFLGVHLTTTVDGGVHAGPNAVLALAREGYDWRTINVRDLAATFSYSGFWGVARTHVRSGASEIRRSLSRKRFAASLARLVPEVAEADLVRAEAGVRAQAVRPDGKLVDDFLIQTAPGQIHVLNAPSPAATSSLEIAKHIASLLPR